MRYLIFTLILVLTLSSPAFALKCDKCHKDDKNLNLVFQQKGIKTKDELFNILRNGKMSKLHKNLTDDEIAEASKIMNLK